MKKIAVIAMAAFFAAGLIPQGLSAAGAGPDDLTGFRVGKKTTVGTKVAVFDSSNFNISTPEGPPPDNFQDLSGMAAGVFVSFSLGGPVYLQPEVYYSRRGSRLQEGGDKFEYKLDYLEVPLLLKLAILRGPVSPVLFGGPYGSLLVKARGVTTIEGRSESEDLKELFKNIDYGLVFGGGLEFRAGRLLLLVEGRYTLGLANIATEVEDGSVKNKGFSVLLGIGF